MADTGKITKAHEDYLEAIVMLGGTDKVSVRSVDIANKLSVSKASVNKAIASLRSDEMLDMPPYGDVTLTKKGFMYGTKILERHNLLSGFLNNQLGIPEDVAEEEACMMEHAISDESFEKWIAYIKTL